MLLFFNSILTLYSKNMLTELMLFLDKNTTISFSLAITFAVQIEYIRFYMYHEGMFSTLMRGGDIVHDYSRLFE